MGCIVVANLTSPSRRLAASLGVSALMVLGTATGALVAVSVPTQAVAQGFFSAWDFAPKPRKVRKAKTPRPPKDKEVASSVPERSPNGPLVINVSIRSQRVTVYDRNGVLTEAPISTGRVGYPTPTGVFTVIEKDKVHFSNLYGNAPMPNMQRITQSGVALHAGELPGYPASHGCIRLPHGFSQKLFGLTTLGTRVIVSREPAPPVSIAHERLFAALPPEGEASSADARVTAGTQVADATNRTVPAEELASPALPPKPTFRETWKARMSELAAAVGVTEMEKGYAFAAASAAARAADQAFLGVKAAKAELARKEQAAKSAAGAKQAAEQEFAAFARKLTTTKEMSSEALQKAAESEDTLEAKAFDMGLAAEAAVAAVSVAKAAVKVAEAKAAEAAAAKRAAADAFAKAKTEHVAAIAANEAAKRRDAKRPLPVSVFISRATQRLYVRQGYEPIFDMPVTIEAPEKPIGTHVFTALDYKPGKTEMNWTVASVSTAAPARADATSEGKRKKKAKLEAKLAPITADTDAPQTAAAALERLGIPEEAREQIADVMKPGSSLVISDYGISKETGKYTDFIILTR